MLRNLIRMAVAALAVAGCDQNTTQPGKSGVAAVEVVVPAAGVSSTTGVSVGLRIGQTVQLVAVPKDSAGNPVPNPVVMWASSNSTVASITVTGLVTAKSFGNAVMTATSGGVSGSLTISVLAAPVFHVSVLPATAIIQVGQAVKLAAITTDSAGNVLLGRVVTWASSNSAAKVDTSGLVTGLAIGSATITATSETKTGIATIAIGTTPPPDTTTALFKDNFESGYASGWTPVAGTWAVVQDGSNYVYKNTANQSTAVNGINPGDNWATAGNSNWADYSVEAKIKPLTWVNGVGIARVFARYQNTSNWYYLNLTSNNFVQLRKYVNGVITDLATPVSFTVQTGTWYTVRLEVQGTALRGYVNNTLLLSATDASFSTGSVGVGGWSNTAEFDDVVVRALGPVSTVPVATVAVNPATASVGVGQTAQLAAVLKDASGNTLTGRSVTWVSSATSVATVNSSGLVTGVAAGSATVTATSEGKSGTAAVTVTAVSVASVTVSPVTASIAVGGTQQFTAVAKDASGNTLTGRVFTWTSSATSLVTISTSGLALGILPGSATISAATGGKTGTATLTVTPPISGGGPVGHVVVVTEENTNYSSSVGSMPWLDGQIVTGGAATNYYAVTHPSIGNYFMLATGQIITNNDGYSTIVNVDNIVRRLLAAGKTWKSYAEDLPNVGYLGGDQGGYARKHNVFALLSDVANDPNQAKNIVPFTQFQTDLANGTLPAFSNVVPNLCNDAHDCSLSTADNWLKTNIAPLLSNAQFQKDGLLIITFDESGGDNTNGGGKVEWVAIGPTVKHGYKSSNTYLHQGTLRLILKSLGITTYPGAAASAADMSEFLNVTVGGGPLPVKSVQITPSTASLNVGGTLQLTATARDSLGNVVNSLNFNWSSSNPNVATTSTTGLITGVAAGAATVTATTSGISGSASITVTTTTPPPVATTCTPWSGTTITLTGLSTTPYQNTSMANNTRIDATNARWLLNQPNTWNRMDGGSGACWMGGQIMGTISPATPYDDASNGYHLMYGLIADAGTARVENLNIFTGGDGIALDAQAADNWSIRGTHIRYARDDAIENDFLNNGLIDDVLVEGAYTFISSRTYTGSPDGTNKTVTVQNSLAWLEGMDANYYGTSRPGSGGFWKWIGSGWPNNGNGPSLVINNSVFRADAAPVEGEGSGEYFAPPKLKSCSNNVLIWLGAGSMPRAWPSCFTVMTGQAGLDYWNQRVADWKARHPAGADFTPPIIALFRIPSTLTGTVSLLATAVDDQTLAGVTFKLNGSTIGTEILADYTDHAVLSWDSRTKANGSYTLTATARDAAGHSTTSAGVSITVSN